MSQISDLIVRLPTQEDSRHPAVDAALRAADSTLRSCIESSPVTVIVAGSAATAMEGVLTARRGLGTVHRTEDLQGVLDELEVRRNERGARPAGGLPSLGLEPRYLRKRRELASEPVTVDTKASPKPIDMWIYPSPPPSVDIATRTLRQVVMENEEPPAWRIPARVTWPIATVLSLGMWYGLLKLAFIAYDLSFEL